MNKDSFTKENIDDLFKELGKEFRKLNGNKMPAEIVVVGGAAIVAKYGFRDTTTDIDALLYSSSAMKEAINKVGDKYNFSNGWINQDFKKTSSYSDQILLYSKPYRTFSNVLTVRMLPDEYLVAMKLASFRAYKHDRSDIIGIINESHVSEEKIRTAVNNLYGKWGNLCNANEADLFLKDVYKSENLKELLDSVTENEQDNFKILKKVDSEYDNVLNKNNVDDVIKAAQKAQLIERLKDCEISCRENSKKTGSFSKSVSGDYLNVADCICDILKEKDSLNLDDCISKLSKFDNSISKNIIERITSKNIEKTNDIEL
ncbi:MAG: hypothetical protein J5525_12835 [Lachnospiraceae bacterium]|nr:hypothetical protein [Lachnospiraceae bacterium]